MTAVPPMGYLAGLARRRDFLAFLATNGTAAMVNVLCGMTLAAFMPYWVAVVLAYSAGMVTAYSLSRAYVFGASGRRLRIEVARYVAVNAVTLGQVLLVSLALADHVLPALGWTWHSGAVAHVVGVGSPVLVSYHGHRRFTFSKVNPEGDMGTR